MKIFFSNVQFIVSSGSGSCLSILMDALAGQGYDMDHNLKLVSAYEELVH